MRPSDTPLIDSGALRRRVAELAAEIGASYARYEEPPILLTVLKGAAFFAADLARAMARPVEMDFVRVQSYEGASSTGTVTFLHYPESALRGRHVLIVEDILDTGRTARAIVDWLQTQELASLRLCTLLDKPSRRLTPLHAEHVGFTIPNQFVIGYGLDYDERYRNLPAIHVLESGPDRDARDT